MPFEEAFMPLRGREIQLWAKGLRTLGGFQNLLPGLGLIKPSDTPGKDNGKQL